MTTQVQDLVRELVEVHNLRLRIQRLKFEGDELAQYGPIKPPDKQVTTFHELQHMLGLPVAWFSQ